MDQPPRPNACNVDFLARVEGETAFSVTFGGQVDEVKLKIWEPPRFFEGFLVGRKYSEVPDIVARICGICPISHMMTALQAIEKAMGVDPSSQTKALRRLMTISQIVASHLVHLYMFALPDYFGYPGFIPMMPNFKQDTDDFLHMKDVMNKIGEIIGGRPLHPISMVVDGFTKIPSKNDFAALAESVEQILPLAGSMVHLIGGLEYPELKTEADFLALYEDQRYAVNEGHLLSSRGIDADIKQYYKLLREQEQNYAMAKKSFKTGDGLIMVGALARVNLKFHKFHPETISLAREIGFRLPDRNPYHNNIAQSLEAYNGMLECMDLLRNTRLKEEAPKVEIRAGEGLAVTEAPRGLLMHSYRIDRAGVVEKANIVTPTSHNFANIEADIRSLAEGYTHNPDMKKFRMDCEKLIRAYDPCFSCSVH